VLGLFVLALAAQSQATTIILTMANDINVYHSYTYTDIDGTTHQEYSGPYPATLSGGSYGSGAGVFVMCYDINMSAYLGASYNGVFEPPTEENEIEAAYLQNKLEKLGGYNADVQTISGPIAMAVWQLMDTNSYNPAPFVPDRAAIALVAEAQTAYHNGTWTQSDAAHYAFWEPTPTSMTQRFGFVSGQAPTPPDIVPEPASAVLMAAGFGLVLALRRKAFAG
jgi:hypothetical protein